MQLRRFAVKLQKCGNVTWLSIDMGGEYNNLIFIFGCTYPLSFTCATSLDWSVVWNWAAVPKKIHEESCAQTFSRASNWILMDAKRVSEYFMVTHYTTHKEEGEKIAK